MYAENEPAIDRNEAVLNNLPPELYTMEADDKIPDNCKYPLPMILATWNQKQTDTGGLAKLLKLKIGAKVMLTANVDIRDRLINGQTGNVEYIEFVQFLVIEKCETEIPIKKGFTSSSIRRTRLPLTLAWASTVRKVQGLSLEQGVVDFDLQNQRSLGAGQLYTALSRVKTYDNPYCIGEFEKSAIKINKDALLEYERLKENYLFSRLKRSIISHNTITILVHNVRSLSKHVNDIVSDSRIMNVDIGLTESQYRQ